MNQIDKQFQFVMFMLHLDPLSLILKLVIVKYESFTGIMISVKEYIHDQNMKGYTKGEAAS